MLGVCWITFVVYVNWYLLFYFNGDFYEKSNSFAIFLSACAPSEEKFNEQNTQITCDLIFECTSAEDVQAAQDMGFWFFGADSAECVSILSGEDDSADDTALGTTEGNFVYDKNAAKECLAELEALTCDDFSVETTLPSCEKVYTEE